jgi:hypothetical protein
MFGRKRAPVADGGQWQRDDKGQRFVTRGRFKLAVVQVRDRWRYSVSDEMGQIDPMYSHEFDTEEDAVREAENELTAAPPKEDTTFPF